MKNSKERLQEAQDLLRLNQKELGVYIGVSTRTINSWMTGERECPAYVAELALRAATADKAIFPATGMMRWAVIQQNRSGEFLTVCGSKADALREGERLWAHLTQKERKEIERFEVSLIHVSILDREYDGTRFGYYENESGAIDGDTYETAKDWKH